MKNAIEGDIEAAFDSVNREKLLNILSKKIHDNKVLHLIKERLNYEFVEKTPEGKNKRFRPTLGIPQGGIDSPYLFNIYMHELDQYIEYELKKELSKMNKVDDRSKITHRIYNEARGELRRLTQVKKQMKKADTPEKVERLKSIMYYHIKRRKK